jgi:hypothetical protein
MYTISFINIRFVYFLLLYTNFTTMKKILLLLLLSALLINGWAQSTKKLNKTMELAMPGETGGSQGTRGASVAWHPVQKKYYASFAGNINYPMAVFDIKGKRLSPDDLTTQFDTRGLWYNSKTKNLEANGHDVSGWIRYTLDAKGIPDTTVQLFKDLHQPDAQSVGNIDSKGEKVYFLNGSFIQSWSSSSGEKEDAEIEIQFGKTKPTDNSNNNDDAPGDGAASGEAYNNTTVIFTGIAGAEFALLKILEPQIELYNLKGYLTRIYKLPENTPAETMFNFAYTNGTWWLFSIDERKWYGYK